MREPHRAGHVDSAMDRGDPCRAGKRMHHARRPEDRQSTDDPQPRIPCLQRQRFAIGNGDFDLDILGRPTLQRSPPHHLARHRVDRRLARRNRQSGLGHHAHARPRREADAGTALAHRGDHHAAMRDIGIITRILDDSSPRPALAQFFQRQRKGRRLALRQGDRHRIGKLTGPQCRKRRLHRRGCACARRPAASQFPFRLVLPCGAHVLRYNGAVAGQPPQLRPLRR